MTKVIVLELNELNLDAVEHYIAQGALPHFAAFFQRHGYCETTSETLYEELEPWIQWVTVHTGLSFSDHGIFRLGDVVGSDTPQIWEHMERELQLTVGAVSPMNAANRASRPAFFIPDPWTPTPASGSWLTRQLSGAVSQAVNDNARGVMTGSTIGILLLGLARFGLAQNYSAYAGLGMGALRRPWNRVSFLDLFLSDVFIGLTKKTRPQFSTLFLNGAAHLQHHYMFNSPACANGQANPSWYIGRELDPVGHIYAVYDRILGSVQRALPDYRVLIITGLHQDPYGAPEYYWRLRDHAAFLRSLGLQFEDVQPRMSRDFVVRFATRSDLENAAGVLLGARIGEDQAFSVEKRDDDIFVQLVVPYEITDATTLRAGDIVVENLKKHVVFVALKNGHHSAIGYFSDSGRQKSELPRSIPLTQIYDEILASFRNGADAHHRTASAPAEPLRERI